VTEDVTRRAPAELTRHECGSAPRDDRLLPSFELHQDCNVNPTDRLTRCFLDARDDLLRYLKRRTRRAELEDVLQDTWLNLRERGDPASWREPRAVLFTTAGNLATDAHRRAASAGKVFSREVAQTHTACTRPDPQSHTDTIAHLERLTAALEELPVRCREAFLLNRLEALTHAEIAARLGVSTKSVQRYIERALRHCLQACEP
jgi:RNA polymerase sigma factor (sigma-70 family)